MPAVRKYRYFTQLNSEQDIAQALHLFEQTWSLREAEERQQTGFVSRGLAQQKAKE